MSHKRKRDEIEKDDNVITTDDGGLGDADKPGDTTAEPQNKRLKVHDDAKSAVQSAAAQAPGSTASQSEHTMPDRKSITTHIDLLKQSQRNVASTIVTKILQRVTQDLDNFNWIVYITWPEMREMTDFRLENDKTSTSEKQRDLIFTYVLEEFKRRKIHARRDSVKPDPEYEQYQNVDEETAQEIIDLDYQPREDVDMIVIDWEKEVVPSGAIYTLYCIEATHVHYLDQTMAEVAAILEQAGVSPPTTSLNNTAEPVQPPTLRTDDDRKFFLSMSDDRKIAYALTVRTLGRKFDKKNNKADTPEDIVDAVVLCFRNNGRPLSSRLLVKWKQELQLSQQAWTSHASLYNKVQRDLSSWLRDTVVIPEPNCAASGVLKALTAGKTKRMIALGHPELVHTVDITTMDNDNKEAPAAGKSCHQKCFSLLKQGAIRTIVGGFALKDNGTWTFHSWGLGPRPSSADAGSAKSAEVLFETCGRRMLAYAYVECAQHTKWIKEQAGGEKSDA